MRRLIALVGLLTALASVEPAHAEATRWVNGRWFDGQRFTPRTVYSVDGRLTDERPTGPLREVDLKGGYVTPAFGDAHHHGVDRADGLSAKIQAFLRDGVFYVKNPNVIPDYLSADMRAQLNRPDSIDVAFANGGLTGTGGHPGPLHDRLAANGVFPGLGAADMPGRAYVQIDDPAQLSAVWPKVLAGRPDFIKVFLNGSVRMAHRDRHAGTAAGVSPAVLKAVVQKAHAAGLRVTAHIDTARDFDVAVGAGVDELGHMPLPDPLEGPLDAYRLTPAMAQRAAVRGVTVVATAGTLPRFRRGRWSAADLQAVVNVQRANLELLRAKGVKLAIGSDGISGETPFVTGLDEVRYLAEHRLADSLTLLKMWSEVTPATIFPGRRIGRLAEGYEANFLVLDGDPLADPAALARIVLRVKAGRPLQVAPRL